ncbi:FIG00545237: hypothetical protein [hydrothermal vent metagenome]|uniref:Lipoprotein, NLP/P60 family n=1 Tax=hydrothermal vent metagenome TaxID=652676 RepID=A0A1W1BB39_9ZZZZ
MIKQLLLVAAIMSQTILYADYILVAGKRAKSQIDRMPKGKIADMKRIPQNPAYYAKQMKSVSYKKQLEWDREYNQKYFYPWRLKKMDKPLVEMEWPFRSVTKKKIYNKRGGIIPSTIYNSWINNANFSQLNSVHQRGITTRHVDVRALPTTSAFYHNPKKVGEGFPFDYNQNSSYHINTPLYISHYSLDRRWAFVRGSTTYGWIQTSGLAVVDNSFIKRFKNGKYAVVVKDNLKLYRDKRYITLVKLGAIFPMIKDPKNSKKSRFLFAVRGKGGKAYLQSATTKQRGLIIKKPIAMTPRNAAKIAQEFYGEPYGWGGLLQTRDCSSFTKDYFTPFGIFLRRNSSKQARDGDYCSIRGLPKDKKKRSIISKAKPFRSMLYVPGHIVLYLGEYKGEPVIMHTYWGARLKDGSKKVLARTVITTTEPGRELPNIKESSKLANTLKAIITPGEK